MKNPDNYFPEVLFSAGCDDKFTLAHRYIVGVFLVSIVENLATLILCEKC